MRDAHTELANMIHSNHSPTKAASVPLIQQLKHITCPAHYTALTVQLQNATDRRLIWTGRTIIPSL